MGCSAYIKACIELNLPSFQSVHETKAHQVKLTAISNMKFCSSSVLLSVLLLQLLQLQASTMSLGNSNSGSTTTTVETHRLQAIEDVTLGNTRRRNDPNILSLGLKPRFHVKRALMKFEDIPESCMYVEKAEIFLYYFESHKERWHSDAYAPFIPRKIEVRQILKKWKETEATTSIRHGTEKWKELYLEFNDTDARIEADDSYTIYPHTPIGYIKFDITPMTQKWTTGEENFGLVLSAENELSFGREVRIYSREKDNEAVKPYLRLQCWTDFCAPISKRRGDKTMSAGNPYITRQ